MLIGMARKSNLQAIGYLICREKANKFTKQRLEDLKKWAKTKLVPVYTETSKGNL
jgi:hypothetical protein